MNKKSKNKYIPFENELDFKNRSLQGLENIELEALNSIVHKKNAEVFEKKQVVPFYISTPSNYTDSLLKIVIYDGPGFKDWGLEVTNHAPLSLMQLHSCYMEEERGDSPFWRYYHYLDKKSKELLSKDAISWIPNTLRKFNSKNKPAFSNAVSCNDALLRSELKILVPDILIIMSNPNNEEASITIQRVFGAFRSVQTNMDRVYRLYFEDSEIPCLRCDSAIYQEATLTYQQIQDYIYNFAVEQLRIRYAQY